MISTLNLDTACSAPAGGFAGLEARGRGVDGGRGARGVEVLNLAAGVKARVDGGAGGREDGGQRERGGNDEDDEAYLHEDAEEWHHGGPGGGACIVMMRSLEYVTEHMYSEYITRPLDAAACAGTQMRETMPQTSVGGAGGSEGGERGAQDGRRGGGGGEEDETEGVEKGGGEDREGREEDEVAEALREVCAIICSV